MDGIKSFIQKADLHYQGIERIPEAGMPIGNGRMGSLVWMDSEELHMQWNRADVFANDASSQSFPEMDTDYSSGTGFVDLSFGSGKDAVFSDKTRQDLSVYEGRLSVKADKVEIEIFPDMDRDICYLHICDQRDNPQKIRLSVRTLRGGQMYLTGQRPQIHPSLRKNQMYTYERTGAHLAVSCLEKDESRIRLRQTFEEKEYFCQSLLEVCSPGRHGHTKIRNAWEAVFEWEAQKGEFWIEIATAQSFEKSTLHSALESEEQELLRIRTAKRTSEEWWSDFWKRAPKMKLESADGKADVVSIHSVYFLYLMAITSRGTFMPRYGGLLFYTAGDYRYWGAQYWWHNQFCYYAPLVKMGCFELAESCFTHVRNSMENYRKAARQQWWTEGIFIPETCWFSGPCEIPDTLQEEVRALYTLEKPWEDRSAEFREFAKGRNTYESRWNWEDPQSEDGTRGYGPYAYVTHIFSTTAKVAMLFWLRYVESNDLAWLEKEAYPVIKGAAMMYLKLPFFEQGADGYLHILHVNNHEELWDACDTISELSGIHGILPIAVRAARILKKDETLCQQWEAFDKKVVPILTNESEHALLPRKSTEAEMWCAGAGPVRMGSARYYHNMDPINIYHILTMETENGQLREIGENTYQKCLELHGYGQGDIRIGELDPFILTPAKLGDKKAVVSFLPAVISDVDPEYFIDREGTAHTVVLDNRMTLREGVQAIGAQRLGQAAEAMACALCNAVPKAQYPFPPGNSNSASHSSGRPSNRCKTSSSPWVRAKKIHGRMEEVKFESRGNASLLVRNPWGNELVIIDYGDKKETVSGEKFRICGDCRIYQWIWYQYYECSSG